jgi:acyl transferase domain-containing protein/acyl-CoA synthetase (AMP-forming)/AMP-acid ligase II/acyl carrier protein
MKDAGDHPDRAGAMRRAPESLIELLQWRAREMPERDAVQILTGDIAGMETLSYGALWDRACAAAAVLTSARPQGGAVLLALPTCAALVTAFLGAVLAGLRPAILPAPRPGSGRHMATTQRTLQLVAQHGRALICTTPDGRDTLIAAGLADGPAIRLLALREGFDRPGAQPWTAPPAGAETPACLQYTAGSTRQPRGIVLSHANILANMADIMAAFDSGPATRALGWLPLHHDMGLFGHLIQPIFAGGTAVLAPPEWFARDPLDWLRAITALGITDTGAPPFAWHLLTQALAGGGVTGLDLGTLRVAHVGAEPVHPGPLCRAVTELSRHGMRADGFLPCYGMAEATVFAAGSRFPGSHGSEVSFAPGASTTLRIADPGTGAELPPGESGEIWLSGPSVARGYDGNPEATARAFVWRDGRHWLRSGDLGRMTHRGLSVIGRSDNRIMYRGVTHHAEDLEATLRDRLPRLAHAALAAVSLPGPAGEELAVVAELRVSHDEGEALRRDIIIALADGHALAPARISFAPPGALPRTTSGKLRHGEIAAQLKSGRGPGPVTDPVPVAARPVADGPDAAQSGDEPQLTDTRLAITGMACRFPGGDDPDSFWQSLLAGRDLVTAIPAARWDVEAYHADSPATPGRMNTRRGGFITGVDLFDAAFFGLSDPEAAEMDPQQRLALEVSWRALEHAGLTRESLRGSATGVFLGISTTDYAHLQIRARPDLSAFSAWSGLGTAQSIAANRISFAHDLRGPSIAVDTACSSSLSALHIAAGALLRGDCDTALVGGVNLMLSPGTTVALAQFGMLASDGACKVFDARADGYVRSEGCGFVVLKRLHRARADGDRILALIRATAAAQDGHSKGITAPNPEAQQALILQALGRARLDPGCVSYVEAHGTGTAIGDPAELKVLRRVYGAAPGPVCRLGSVKASAGHLEAAAGIASLIKTVQVLRHRMVPPQLHFRELPASVDLGSSRLRIPVRPEPLRPPGDAPLYAAVSSFGFGGALAHVILQAADPAPEPSAPRPDPHADPHADPQAQQQAEAALRLLPVSARSERALQGLTRDLACHARTAAPGPLAPLVRTLTRHRSHFSRRGFVLARDLPDAARALEAGLATGSGVISELRPGFLFTGQGAHLARQGQGLAQRFPVFAEALGRAAAALSRADPRLPGLHEILFGDGTLLKRIDLAQPALIALSYALDRLWRSLGVAPAAMTGHSLGEIAACLSAGALELDGAMLLALRRGRLMAGLPHPGAMAGVALSAGALQARLDDWRLPGLSVAAENGPAASSLAGPEDSMAKALDRLSQDRVAARRLATPVAFHSAVLDPVLDGLERAAADIPASAPQLPVISTLTGAALSAAPDGGHWRRHAREPVRFAAALTALQQAGCTHYIEIGPGRTLTALVRATLPDRVALPSLPGGDMAEDAALLGAAGVLYADGATLNWAGFDLPADAPIRAEDVPGHPFQRRRYWFDMDLSQPGGAEAPLQHAALRWPLWQAPADPPATHAPMTWDPARNWLIVGDGNGMAEALAQQLCARGCRVIHLSRTQRGRPWATRRGGLPGLLRIVMPDSPSPDAMARALIGLLPRPVPGVAARWGVLVPAALDMETVLSPELAEAQQHRDGIGLLTTLVQALRVAGLVGQMYLLTRAGVQTSTDALPDPAQAALWGFGATLFLEHPDLRGGMMDLDRDTSAGQILDRLDLPGLPGMLALRGGQPHAPELVPLRPPAGMVPVLDPKGTYLVTGGLGGLGLEIAVWLAERGAGRVVLMSRSADAGARITHAGRIARIEAAGAEVGLMACDTGDFAALRDCLSTLRGASSPLRGIVHAAGQNWLGRIADTAPGRMLETMRLKAGAALVLHEATRDMRLDLFVICSSISALWGSVALAHYAAANRFADALVEMRRAQGLVGTSIDWGPWAEIGMSARPRETEVVTAVGLPLIPPGDALLALERALAAPEAVQIVARLDWQRFGSFADYSLWPGLFASLRRAATSGAAGPAATRHLAAELAGLPEDAARGRISAAIRRELATLAHLPPGREISEAEPFSLMGIDSLTAIGFAMRLEAQTGVAMPPTLAYTHPTIADVVDFVLAGLAETVGRDAGKPVAPTAGSGAPAALAARPAGLSVICLPYAGAPAAIFAGWQVPGVALRPVELPGRGTRHHEAPAPSIRALAVDLAQEIARTGGSEVIYGHSFGARLAFETARLLPGPAWPKLLILSCLGPQPPDPGGIPFDGRDAGALARHARDWHGEIADPAAWNSLLPGLRHDLALLAEAGPVRGPALELPMLVIGGRDDPLAPPESLIAWQGHVTGRFSLTLLSGGHMPFRTDPEGFFRTFATAIREVSDKELPR